MTFDDLNGKTIKEYLLGKGMKESDFDNYESTLYVRVTSISQEFVREWEYRGQITTFKDNIEGVLYYDIPFGYINENIKERREASERFAKWVRERNGKDAK